MGGPLALVRELQGRPQPDRRDPAAPGAHRARCEHQGPAPAMLAHHRTPDSRVLPVFKRIMAEDDDRKLRLHAEQGLKRYAETGLRE